MKNCNPSGPRNQKISFLEETFSTDENGDSTGVVSVRFTVWASVQAVAAREEDYAGQLTDMRVMLFYFERPPRFSNLGLNSEKWRIKWQGREHNITEIKDDESGIVCIKAISGVAQ